MVLNRRLRTTWLDAARGLAISLVVLLHASEWLALAGFSSAAWLPFHTVATGVRIPLFFAVSGLLAQRWRTAGWRELFSGRLLLLIWVYLLWQVEGSATALVSAQITGDQLTAPRMLMSLAATVVRPRFELWFLWALVIFLVAARATARVPVRVQLAGASVLSAIFFSDLVPTINLGWNGVPSCYVFFLAGLYGREAILRAADRLTPVAGASIVLGWLALASLVFWAHAGGVLGVGFVVRMAGLAAGICLAVLLARWTTLRSLGAQTLPVYVAHTPMIVLMAWALQSLGSGPGGVHIPAPWLLPPLVAVLAIVLSLGLYRFLLLVHADWVYAPPAFVTAYFARGPRRPGRHVAGASVRRPAGAFTPSADAHPAYREQASAGA